MSNLVISVIGSVIATVVVLITRVLFYRFWSMFPARSLFNRIVGADLPCKVYILRMTDIQRSGHFLAPNPRYAVVSQQPEFEERQNIPWVASVHETYCVAHILNTLGTAGRSKDIEVSFPDDDFDAWDSPMFLIGGHWKTRRAFARCRPLFVFESESLEKTTFRLLPTGETFTPATLDQDIALLQKMTNPTTEYPVWIAMGWRGAGTSAATYFLAKQWRTLGWLYGKESFGIVLEMNDRDGWQQTSIVRIYPAPKWYRRLIHFRAWKRLKRLMNKIENRQNNALKSTVTTLGGSTSG